MSTSRVAPAKWIAQLEDLSRRPKLGEKYSNEVAHLLEPAPKGSVVRLVCDHLGAALDIIEGNEPRSPLPRLIVDLCRASTRVETGLQKHRVPELGMYSADDEAPGLQNALDSVRYLARGVAALVPLDRARWLSAAVSGANFAECEFLVCERGVRLTGGPPSDPESEDASAFAFHPVTREVYAARWRCFLERVRYHAWVGT